MSTLFSARRKPKRIARDEPVPADPEAEDANIDAGPIVRRPAAAANKNKSRLRISFNPTEVLGETNSEHQEDDPAPLRKPKLGASTFLQVGQDQETTDKPSYDKAYLDELRNSTPSTPKEITTIDTHTGDADIQVLDVESKFGRSAITSASIPSEAEIREKKERRARLAKQQGADDFIALEDYDSDGEFKPQRMQVGTYFQRDSEKETRLVRDDEDIAEGFDEFIEDSGRVTLSRKGAKEQSRHQRKEIKEMIEEAEDDSDEDESDVEQHQAYEMAQTHHGMDGVRTHKTESRRPKQPRDITQIPKLAVCLARLKGQVQQYEDKKVENEKLRAAIREELVNNSKRQAYIQTSLEEAGHELERLQNQHMNRHVQPVEENVLVDRGLESFGGTPEPSTD